MQELVTVRIVLVARACSEGMAAQSLVDSNGMWAVQRPLTVDALPWQLRALRASVTVVALRADRPPIRRQELLLALLAVSGEYFPSVASLIGTHLSLVQLSLATLYVKYMRGTTGHEPGLTHGNGLTVAKDVEQTHVGRSVAP